ncbi:YbaY family lipoprotein [Nocardia brasiliensis]|uniref:YbaY family lipoprotein n=1 Tax=Nocardia brasiliensis TaxID=37326 RepID=UPI002457F99D|nr:YbaY family lipoprotein [Nocardia brasiliensis]
MTEKTRWIAGVVAVLIMAGTVCYALTNTAAQADSVEPRVVTGELSFPGGPPPAGSVITVRLVDVSLADAPAIELARAGLALAEPARFELRAGRVDPRRTLAVSADVYVDGKLRWITDTRHTVPTEGAVPFQRLTLKAIP